MAKTTLAKLQQVHYDALRMVTAAALSCLALLVGVRSVGAIHSELYCMEARQDTVMERRLNAREAVEENIREIIDGSQLTRK